MILSLVSFAHVLLDTTNQLPTQMANNSVMAAVSAFWFVWLLLFVFEIYCAWRVAQKCGYPGAYSLLLLIPLVNVIVILVWVFSRWPIEAELQRLRGGSIGSTATSLK